MLPWYKLHEYIHNGIYNFKKKALIYDKPNLQIH